ncbi:hypothetical protein [Aquipuribacter sp. SD81]|uniref:hypothetical protein n=1 Tax=Aquipuribacter sp. SD81 TaxID=3127703 RepID=UPI00301AF624
MDTPDEVRSEPLYRWGWLDGYADACAVSGVTVAPLPSPQWLEDYLARQRSAVADARSYAHKPAPKTAAQIAAEVAYSWRRAEVVA